MDAVRVQPLASASLLEGVQVLELSSRLPGAYAGRLLASMGASVRRVGPELELNASATATPFVEQWLQEEKTPYTKAEWPAPDEVVDGMRLVIAELDSANVEFRSWVDAVILHATRVPNPPVVVTLRASILHGADVAGTGLTSSAWSGISWSIGDADKVPLTLPFDLAEYQAGVQASAAGLAALLADPTDPALRAVDVAGRDVLAFYTGMITTNFIPYERPWTRDGARPPGSAGVYPASIFACQDGHVVFMCRSQREWDILLAAMGSPTWSQDPRFADPRVVARLYADEADQYLVPWIAAQTQRELLKFGQENGLPIAPVRSIREALDEPQLAHRDFLTSPAARPRVKMPTEPWKLYEPARRSEPTVGRQWPLVRSRPSAATSMLTGLRVLDLSWVWSGPMTTSILADMGADVLKVEHTGHMDTGRLRGKARRNGVEVDGPEHEATPYFNQMNHAKRSITMDLKQPRAREILLDLCEQCDIVVENMRPGVLDRLGIGYPDLAARNPGLVMLSMSMAGQTGPLKGMKGYAGIMAAMSGLESLIGYDADNIVGSLSAALGDPNAAGHAMSVLFAALYRRRVSGCGAWIDLSQIEALLSVLAAPIVESQLDAELVVPMNSHPRFVPHGHFTCAGEDQWIAIAVRTDDEWTQLAEQATGTVLAAREDWRQGCARLADRDHVEAAVSEWTGTQERDVVVQALLERGVAAAPVASFRDLMGSSWKSDRRLTLTVAHPYLGETEVFTVPWKFGGTTAGIAKPAPLLGADTESILCELLGMPEEEVRALQAARVLY